MKCFKCGTQTGNIINHHISYIPERIVDCCISCHKKLHINIRKQNKCKFSVDEVGRLSSNSTRARYSKKYNLFGVQNYLNFMEKMMTNVYLREQILYNPHTGIVSYSSSFSPASYHKLKEVLC